MDVSVVILNYNTFQLTVNCINSIIKKTNDIEIEIILVDNASTECSPDIFLKYFPNIVLVSNNINLGFSKGNNIGIAKAKSDCVLLINSDTELINNAIKTTYINLSENPKVAAVTAKVVYPDGKPQSVCQRFPNVKYQLLEFIRIHKLLTKKMAGKLLLGSFFNYDTNIKADWIWGTYFMFKKDILAKLPQKKLDESFFMYGEDMQWCMDFRKVGYDVCFCCNAEIVHYLGASKANANEMIKKNYNAFLERNYTPIHLFFIKLLSTLLNSKI